MSQIKQPAWEQLRGQGRSRFILRGLMQRGFKIAAPTTAGFYLADLLAHRLAQPVSETVFLLKVYVLLTLLVGWVDGSLIWAERERDLRKAKLKRTSHS
jgi:hypothetical protein